MGAPTGSRVDQQLKLKCMVSMWEHRKWSAVLLADVKYIGRGVREVEVNGRVWTFVHHDEVAVALNSDWAERWRAGGAECYRGRSGRVVAVGLPGKRVA